MIDHFETVFSPCRRWRYTLWRSWGEDWKTNYCQFIGLNPSTADEVENDPTVRRCIRYAKDWGYSALCMTNIFAYRATDPKDMFAANDRYRFGANGKYNDHYLIRCSQGAKIVIAAWGVHGSYLDRGNKVKDLIPNLHCLRKNKNGSPAHPLYLPASLTPVKF